LHRLVFMVVCLHGAARRAQGVRRRSGLFRISAALFLGIAAALFFSATGAAGQNQIPEWQIQVRKYVESQDWAAALRVVERQITRSPRDTDLLAWRARILTWSGRLEEAEAEYLNILKISQKDPDVWMGLSSVYLREGKNEEALRALDTAVELDPKRADLHAARGRALHAAGEGREARHEFQNALALDPASSEALQGIRSFEDEARHELRFGQENDLFNFTGPNHAEWVSLVSRWDSRWTTSLAANTYQRGGVEAGKFVGAITARVPAWGAFTVGGATGHDNGVIPKSEAFFDVDRGWKSSDAHPVRGVELDYGQHWYWYQAARILSLSGTAIVYFPREWTLTLATTGARSAFSGTGAEWRPSGVTRIGFPLARWARRRLSGNLFFAAGSEDFAQVDQIGRFASQTYGGGIRFQLTAKQDITGYASYQKRTQDRTDTNFGFSYGIHF
jgi:tetratricopeptide (TPR) repeat protein